MRLFNRKPSSTLQPVSRPLPNQPIDLAQQLLDMRRRLGRMERDLIDLKIHLKVPRRPMPGEPTIQ